MWPLNIRLGPPPAPSSVASTLARLSSTCCHCTRSPSAASVSRISSAIACSSPVKLGVAIIRLAVSTKRSRSIASAPISADVRQDVLGEGADLAVAVVAPELEHDVRAAGVAVLPHRGDALVGRAGD